MALKFHQNIMDLTGTIDILSSEEQEILEGSADALFTERKL